MLPLSELKRAAGPRLWDDWRWQVRRRVRTLAELRRRLPAARRLSIPDPDLERRFPVGVTPYYLSLVDPEDENDPILLQILPLPAEAEAAPGESSDPFDERGLSPVPGVVRRYPDRALILPTNFCATLCRHCFRKGAWSEGFSFLDDAALEQAVAWIASERAIRDVLVTGGDPLHLPTARLGRLLGALRAIERLDVVRVATRTPATLPQRIDEELLDVVRAVRPVWFVVHFNHAREVTPEAAAALRGLRDAGAELLNQTVLLRGVNDRVEDQEALARALVRCGVRPYYLHSADPVAGAGHFRVPLARARELVRSLHGRLSGFAIPRLVLDLPGGGGKVPIDLGFERVGGDGVRRFQSPIDGREIAVEEGGGEASCEGGRGALPSPPDPARSSNW